MKELDAVTTDNRIQGLACPTLDERNTHHPSDTITENDDMSYIDYINRILAAAEDCKVIVQNGSTIYLLRLKTFIGDCIVRLSRDSSDGTWFNMCRYQLQKKHDTIAYVLQTMSTPAALCREIFFPEPEYTVLCYGGKTISKPAELKGVQKFDSVAYERMCKCSLFLNGQDLYIRHGDYFSPELLMDVNEGYRRKNKSKNLPYNDKWSSVVLKRTAWIRITNFVPLIHILNWRETAETVCSMMRKYHQLDEGEFSLEWVRFFSDVAVKTQKHISQVKSDCN